MRAIAAGVVVVRVWRALAAVTAILHIIYALTVCASWLFAPVWQAALLALALPNYIWFGGECWALLVEKRYRRLAGDTLAVQSISRRIILWTVNVDIGERGAGQLVPLVVLTVVALQIVKGVLL